MYHHNRAFPRHLFVLFYLLRGRIYQVSRMPSRRSRTVKFDHSAQERQYDGAVGERSAMVGERVERRLAAVLAADVAGYSRLIGEDEEGTLAALRAIRREVTDPRIAEHRGRIVKTTGDGLLAEFASVVDALRCAAAWQAAMPADSRIAWRIGINVGDIVVEDGDIFGDGVNVAARLEALAEPGGICVSGRVQEDTGGKLDLIFEDQGEQSLKNIARPVRVYRVVPRASRPHAGVERAGETPAVQPPLALPDKPSIAVLPFQNMSGDPEQEYFADGMVEEIITALSRIRWLFVIARNSSFTYKGQAVDVKQVGRELGVRYVLEGSVRRGGNRVRITAQLIEAETAAHLWADRFDGSMEDVFDLQDRVAISVAGVIEPALHAAETARSARRPTSDITVYDLYLRAAEATLASAGKIPEALRLLEQAIERDSTYAPALAMAAVCHMRVITDAQTDDPAADREKGMALARRALQLAQDDPGTLVNAAMALGSFGEDIDAMIAVVDRAVSLHPSFSRGWYIAGMLRTHAGDQEAAIERLETAQRLSPRGRVGFVGFNIGLAYFLMRRFEEALPRLQLAIQNEPEFTSAYRWLASCYAHMGRLDDARAVLARLREINPRAIPAESEAISEPRATRAFCFRCANGDGRQRLSSHPVYALRPWSRSHRRIRWRRRSGSGWSSYSVRLWPRVRLSTNWISPGANSKSIASAGSSKTSSIAANAAAPSLSTGSPFIA
jgi:adenylate cyclase